MPETLLETVNVVKSFSIRKGFLGRKQNLVAVDGVMCAPWSRDARPVVGR